MTNSFDGQVAIVTGAGGGLGRAYAMALAKLGATVIVNDISPSSGATGEDSPAEKVAGEIKALGGRAEAFNGSVTDEAAVGNMVDGVISNHGRIDVLVNNAGILRDKTFAKQSMDEFRQIVDVHLIGSTLCTKAVWPHMQDRGYGRIVFVSSSSGLYGNFGQSAYGAAKMAVIGLMNTLKQEGEKYGIRVNALSPIATTQMTEELLPEVAAKALQPEYVVPALVYLAGREAPTGAVLASGGGVHSAVRIVEGPGVYVPPQDATAEKIGQEWDAILGTKGCQSLPSASEQTRKFVTKALTSIKDTGIEDTGK